MVKTTFADYGEEIDYQREVWQRKAALRTVYEQWYGNCADALSGLTPTVEIGAGCGNFKAYYPREIASDVLYGRNWIELVMDAQYLALAANGIGNLIAFDVMHHLQRPLEFLRQALWALKPGGRLVLCEPALTPWSRFVYRAFHHEPLDSGWDLFGLDGSPPEPDPGHAFANMAIAEILFWRQRARTLKLLPGFKMVKARKFGFVLYPLSGGFGYRCFLPETGLSFLLRLEEAFTRPVARRLTGMRMLVVLEKRARPQIPADSNPFPRLARGVALGRNDDR
ncbi:MAG: hypothetical protein IVW54_08260 [Candidatus Binataceae bacterium]|nr:hypothetical protein [Candidatus Binataceae bacterium]